MYLDLLILLNAAVNFFLLWITGLIAHQKTSLFRLLFGSLIGAAYIMLVLMPDWSYLFTWPGKICLPLLMVFFAYRPRQLVQGIILLIVFYLCSFALGGLVLALGFWGLFPLEVHSGIYYLPAPSFFYLILAGILLYLLVRWVKPLLLEKFNFHLPAGELQVEICFRGKSKQLSAFLDTGNMLKEPFSGLPVAIAAYSGIEELLPAEICKVLCGEQKMDWIELERALSKIQAASRFCLVPYNSLHDEGFLLAFRPESVKIWEKNRDFKFKEQVIIGIQPKKFSFAAEYELLLPLEIWRSAGRQEG